jgi:hypothetical protein
MVKSVFVVIFGAGRCGSTFLMNQLNKNENTSIYGEDLAATLCLFNSLYRLNQFTEYVDQHPKRTFNTKVVSDETIQNQLIKKQSYIGNELYQNPSFHKNIKTILEQNLFEYFNTPVTGFKEIRWDLFDDLNFLDVIRKYFHVVKFIFLTREETKILQSMTKLWPTESHEKIQQRLRAKHDKISNFLSTQSPESVLKGDITTNELTMEEINAFVYGVPRIK